MVDLNDLIPPGSGLRLHEGVFIGEGGEIAGLAFLDNGDEHAFLLIPKEEDDDDLAEGATDASQVDPALVVRSSTNEIRTRLTPAMLGALRDRIARYRGVGPRLPRKSN